SKTGLGPVRKRWASGRSFLPTVMSGSRRWKRVVRWGARLLRSVMVGLSWSATGLRLVTSGLVFLENRWRRARVRRDWSRKVGKMRNVSASAVERGGGAG